MKKYKLLKDLPGIKAGTIFTVDDTKVSREDGYNSSMYVNSYFGANLKDELWFEPIKEKKTYDDLEEGDKVYTIDMPGGIVEWTFYPEHCRSELFLTREEAEDEHKRREWANRKDKFVPEEKENYFNYSGNIVMDSNDLHPYDIFVINQGLAFRTKEECQDAIDNHDIVRLFYTIR